MARTIPAFHSVHDPRTGSIRASYDSSGQPVTSVSRAVCRFLPAPRLSDMLRAKTRKLLVMAPVTGVTGRDFKASSRIAKGLLNPIFLSASRQGTICQFLENAVGQFFLALRQMPINLVD